MAMHYCPGCMRYLPETEKCFFCGFKASEYQLPNTALPIGGTAGRYQVGMMIASNRQAQFYCALQADTEMPVLLEEFFPYTVAGRRRGDAEIVNVPGNKNFDEACRMFMESRTPRDLELVEAFAANGSVYRAYRVSELSPIQDQCAGMVNQPIFFRGTGGRPVMAINGLDIPPMPPKRAYRSNPKRGAKGKKTLVPWIVGGVAITAICVGAGIFLLGEGGPLVPVPTEAPTATPYVTQVPSPTPTSTPTTAPTPSPTPVPTATPIPEMEALRFEQEALNVRNYLVLQEQYTVTGRAIPGKELTVRLNDGEPFHVTVGEDGAFAIELLAEQLLTERENILLVTYADAPADYVGQKLTFNYKLPIAAPVLDAMPGAGANLTISGQSEPGAVVKLLINDIEKAETTAGMEDGGRFAFTVDKLNPGDQVLIRVNDAAGNAAEAGYAIEWADIVLTIDDLQINDRGYVLTKPPFTVKISAERESGVILKVNGQNVDRKTNAQGQQTYVVSQSQLQGSGEVVVTACYKDNPAITGNEIRFLYKEKTDKPVIANADTLHEGVRVITGQAEAGATVVLSVNGEETASVTAGEDGSFRFEKLTLHMGDQLIFTARDAADNTAAQDAYTVMERHVARFDLRDDTTLGGPVNQITGIAQAGEELVVHVEHQVNGKTEITTENILVMGMPGEPVQWSYALQTGGMDHGSMCALSVHYVDQADDQASTMTFSIDSRCELDKCEVHQDEAGSTVTVTGKSADAVSVAALLDGEELTAVAVDNGAFTLTLDAWNDDTMLVIAANDAYGNVSEQPVLVPERPRQPITITADLSAPFRRVDIPLNGQATAGKALELLLNGKSIGEVFACDENGLWETTLLADVLPENDAVHTLTVQYAGEKAFPGKEAVAKLMVDATCMPIAAADKLYADENTITGQTEPGAMVVLQQPREDPMQVEADANGQFVFEGLLLKAHEELVLHAKDKAGNQTEKTLMVSPERLMYVGEIANATAKLLSESDNAFTLQMQAWAVAAQDVEPFIGVYSEDGKQIATIPMVRAEMPAENGAYSGDEVRAETYWRVEEPSTLEKLLESMKNVELRLMATRDGETLSAGKAEAEIVELPALPTATPEPTHTPEPTATPEPTPTATPNVTDEPTPVPAPEHTEENGLTDGLSDDIPAPTPDAAAGEGDAAAPQLTPFDPSVKAEPAATPTTAPTEAPTATPTAAPTATPTAEPTVVPTMEPTATPEPQATAALTWHELILGRMVNDSKTKELSKGDEITVYPEATDISKATISIVHKGKVEKIRRADAALLILVKPHTTENGIVLEGGEMLLVEDKPLAMAEDDSTRVIGFFVEYQGKRVFISITECERWPAKEVD